MKKSTRILAILMAFVMLLGSFTVLGSAYDAYKGTAIQNQYNDVDAVDFTLDQYASMGLDELDRMLAKEQLVLDIYIGTIDLSSVNTTITSVQSLVSSLSTLLPLLGDASGLAGYVAVLDGVQRTESGKDLDVIYALLNFVASLNPIVTKYVNGTISLGIMNSFIADFIFDVRILAIGLLYGMSFAGEQAGYDAIDDGENGIPAKYLDESKGAITLLQDLLNELILGEWKMLDSELDPANKWSVVMEESYAFYDVESVSAEGEVTFKLKDGKKILVAGEEIDIVNYDYYGWVDNNDWVTVGLGDAFRVPAGSTAPAASYDVVDITTNRTGYDFIETLMQQAYNYILVPVLKRDTIDWVRKLCGVEYDSTKTARTIFNSETGAWENNPAYDPDYRGEPFDPATQGTVYAKFLNPNVDVSTVTIPEGETFVDNFNDILGTVLDSAAIVPRNTNHTTADGTFHWEWQDGGNQYLFSNICSVARFILSITQDLFFSEYVTMPTPTEIADMSNQEVVAFIMRAILNSSVDYIYVDDTYTTVVDVAYRAVEQLAWQDIPQYTYTKPVKTEGMKDEEYYFAVVEKMLDILFDIAVYNLNQGFDMVPASGNDPEAGEGLLQYQGDTGSYKNNLIQIVAWAISEYGAILNLDFFCDDNNGAVTGTTTLTEDHVWQDLDTLINAIIPIKGDGAWLAKEIAGDGSTIVSKTLIFDFILKPLYTLDATNFATIFKKNPDGAFANHNGVTIIIDFLNGIFELLFPGVFQRQTSIDAILNNELLGAMVGDLIKVLGTNDTTNAKGEPLEAQGPDIVKVALPLVALLLGLSDDQEFEEMEIYMPETISATGDAPSFEVFNGSSGINTAYTDTNGDVHQDQLYTYEITGRFVRTYDANGNDTGALIPNGINVGTTISGGDSVTVTLSGTRTKGQLVEFQVTYIVKDEAGEPLTSQELSKTVYAYIGETAEDDDAITAEIVAAGDRKIQYNPSIYLASGDGLDDIESYSIRIKDISGGATASASIVSVNNVPFVAKNPGDESRPISANMTGEEGLYFLSPFNVAEKAAGEYYERYEDFYETDENGDLVLDEDGEPNVIGNNAGVEDGQYNVTTKVNVAGSEYDVNTYIHLYNDYGLDSLFDRAVAANRQKSDYGTGYAAAWNIYTEVLTETARFVLKPKTGGSFATDIVAEDPTTYDNRYEELAVALEAAIEDLDSYAVSAGVDGLKEALAEYSGLNYTEETDSNGRKYKVDIAYDDDNYIYFGMRDYVPHTYNKYRGARDRVTDLIDSQSVFVPAPFEEGYVPTAEEQSAYNAAVAEYDARIANLDVISSIEATYAIHMLNLSGERLIRLKADTSKLQIVYDMCKDALEEGASYTTSSLERYNDAIAFTEEVLATPIINDFGAYDLRPSKVNEATTELMVAWKHLSKSASYQAVEDAIAYVQGTIDTYGDDASAQNAYTPESYQALLDAYDAAVNIEQDLSDSTDNNNYITNIANALRDAHDTLEAAKAEEAVIEFAAPGSLADSWVFHDLNWSQSFTPYISEGNYNHSTSGATTLPDGVTPVDGFIVGFGEGVGSEEETLQIFATLENVNAVVTPSDPDAGFYGSGTVIQLYNAATGALVNTYQIVVVGDLSGDGVVEPGVDVNYLWNVDMGMADYAWNSMETYDWYREAAGDINGDGVLDSMDIPYYDELDGGLGYINQEVQPDTLTVVYF